MDPERRGSVTFINFVIFTDLIFLSGAGARGPENSTFLDKQEVTRPPLLFHFTCVKSSEWRFALDTRL